MLPDRLSWSVALRSLRGSGRLTALTLVVVGVSVVLVIFLTALIEGLRLRLVDETTGAIPHIVIQPREKRAISPSELSTDSTFVIGHRAPWVRQKRKMEDWPRWVRFIEATRPEVVAVSPNAEGSGFAARGEEERPVRIYGVEPARFDRIVGIEKNLVEGEFLRITPGECAIGVTLAENLGVSVGDRLRVTTSEGETAYKRVRGVYRAGFGVLDERTLFMPLGDGQSLFGLGSAVTTVGVRVEDVFEAAAVGQALQKQIPHEVRDWTQDNQRLLSGLEAQKRSSDMIRFFTAVAASFAIASILIVLVTNKLQEIGILKAMGATRTQVRSVFAIQGTFLGLIGAIFGSGLGIAFVQGLSQIRVVDAATGQMKGIFPFALGPEIVISTIVMSGILGFLASVIPARRAARVDPIEVIRGG